MNTALDAKIRFLLHTISTPTSLPVVKTPQAFHPMSAADSTGQPLLSARKTPTIARSVSLSKVAEVAGVSTVAVSVVLNSNSRSKVRVSEATRQRILDAARELNYRPNELARSLNRGRTNVIGFYSLQQRMFDPLYPFYGSVLKGLLQGCEQHKKHLLVHGTFSDVSEEEIFLELLNGQVDGMILYAREPTPLTQRLAESHLPVITVADEVPGLPCVTVDAEMGGRLLARHLAGKGHRRALYWVADEVLPPTVQKRVDGFCQEAAQHGMEVEVYLPKTAWPCLIDIQNILARPERPTVIAAFSDFSAECIISWLTTLGARVPEDIEVAGFDGFQKMFGSDRSYATVRAPWTEVAHCAVNLLVQQCEGATVPMRSVLPVELIPPGA